MRTKALLCAAGLLAAGAFTAMAQSNVYSLNVVGYINVSLTNGFNLMANQMDADGTLTNNSVTAILSTNVPSGTKVYAYNAQAGTYNIATLFASGSWGGAAGVSPGFSPGAGVWVQMAGNSGVTTPTNITLVGNVVQGQNTLTVKQGFQIMSIMAPVSTGITTGAGYQPTQGDKVYFYDSINKVYGIHPRFATTWGGGEPTPAIAQAFWLQAAANTNWVQNFTVQ